MAITSTIPLEDLIGTRFVLLDSVRDGTGTSPFLGTPGSHATDFGLGILDNPLFVFTSTYVPGLPTVPRPFPTKLFWIGSPQGTNDINDIFSIYVADVVPENFAPGVAPAPSPTPSTSWLVNPRLVLDATQAATDVKAWFNANYPGGTNGLGVGLSNTGSNTTYGTLAGGTTAVGNISGVSGIDGQFWPTYDYVDNSILLYFSVKTPNCNTLSIYCYKQPDTEMSTPLTSAQFLGGLFAPSWTAVNTAFSLGAILLSSHRFSICSPDPLVVNPKAAGTQTGVFMYSYGVIDGISSDHGRAVAASVVVDLHGHPLNPGIALSNPLKPSSPPVTSGIQGEHFYTVDKLGSIFAADSVDAPTPGYVCLFNAPAQIDRRNGSFTAAGPNKVVIAAMQLRTIFYNPLGGISFAANAIRTSLTSELIGTCRGQFTDLPDGKTKILYANFSWDQYLNLGYEYIRPDALSPAKQSKIRAATEGSPGAVTTLFTYGKKKALVRLVVGGSPPIDATSLTANKLIQIIGASNADTSNGFGFGFPLFTGSKFVHQDYAFSLNSVTAQAGSYVTEFTIEDIDPYLAISYVGTGKVPGVYVDLID